MNMIRTAFAAYHPMSHSGNSHAVIRLEMSDTGLSISSVCNKRQCSSADSIASLSLSPDLARRVIDELLRAGQIQVARAEQPEIMPPAPLLPLKQKDA